MHSSLLLQIFLGFDLFVMGGLAAVAARHAYAHFRPSKHDAPEDKDGHLPEAERQRLLKAAESNFQAVLTRTADELQHDLHGTTEELNKLLHKLGSDVVAAEMTRYRTELNHLKDQAKAAIDTAQGEIEKHQEELKAKLAAEMEAEKAKFAEEMAAERQRAAEQLATDKQQAAELLDAKLADAVSGFLLETLQHEVDLGAQSDYLLKQLEAHKADLVREANS